MREILFRGKQKDGYKWAFGSLIQAEKYCCILESEEAVHPMDYPYLYGEMGTFDGKATPIIPETVGQYTGLTDKNSKKIFEGDIIRYADLYEYACYLESLDNTEAYDKWDFGNIWIVDEVVYGEKIGYPAFDLNKHNFEINGLSELNESRQYFYEVIGNIHDNPELLGG